MVRLLLTSAGLVNAKLVQEFLDLLEKPVSGVKVVLVPTASRSKEELEYVEESKEELKSLGVKEVKTLNLDKKISYEELKGYDCVYVCGGNTFYLLKKVRESGFDKVLERFLKENKLYVGVSAGSILAGPSIEIAGWGSEGDQNDVHLKELAGLNFTKIAVYPHFKEKLKGEVEEFKKKVKYKVISLTDEQALLVKAQSEKIIR